MSKEESSNRGRKNRQSGAIWERKVRDDLIKQGWFVSKFQSNIEFETKAEVNKDLELELDLNKGKLIPAKASRFRLQSTGFPDFICWKEYMLFDNKTTKWTIIGIEAKSNGYLNKIEKAKCEWLLKNKVFDNILIAKKNKVGRKIMLEYILFTKK